MVGYLNFEILYPAVKGGEIGVGKEGRWLGGWLMVGLVVVVLVVVGVLNTKYISIYIYIFRYTCIYI